MTHSAATTHLPVVRAAAPVWNRLFSVAMAVLAALYAIICAVRVYLLHADAAMVAKIAEAPHSVSRASADSLAHMEKFFDDAYQGLFWSLYLVSVVWFVVLFVKFRAAGKGRVMSRTLAWQVWAAGLLVALVISFFTKATPDDSPAADYVSNDHAGMVFMAIRAVVGVLYVWVAIRMRRSSDPVLANRAAEAAAA